MKYGKTFYSRHTAITLVLDSVGMSLESSDRNQKLKTADVLLFDLFNLTFYGPVNSVKIITRRTVNLLTLFLGRLCPLNGLQLLCARTFVSMKAEVKIQA